MLNIDRFRAGWQSLTSDKKGVALLAVSGGADSMVMASLFKQSGISFAIGHCNFGLRGDESDSDEAMVRQWCSLNDVVFHSTLFDTKASAAAQKAGIQEAARKLRYDWLEQVRGKEGYIAICTAHHQDDNAETLIMNLARGTGIAGLHGIMPRQGHIVRPLLFASRKDIEAFASANNISYRTDASNAKDDYTRNAIRHNVIPALEAIIPGAAAHIHQTAQRIAEAELLYRQSIERERKKLLQVRGKDYYIPIRLLQHRHPLATITFELVQPYGFTPLQTPDILQLLNADSGKYVASHSHKIIRNRDFLIITATETAKADIIPIDTLPATIHTDDGTLNVTEGSVPSVIDNDSNVCYLDVRRLEEPLLLRRWKTGDYFYPLGMGGKKKKLSRFFIDQKLPVHEKERVWVIESNRRIAWICGLRMDDRFKITPSTKKVIKLKFRKD